MTENKTYSGLYGNATYEQFLESKNKVEGFTKKFLGLLIFIGIMFGILFLISPSTDGRGVDIGYWKYFISLLPILICFGIFNIFNAVAIRAFHNEDYHIYNNNVEKYENNGE